MRRGNARDLKVGQLQGHLMHGQARRLGEFEQAGSCPRRPIVEAQDTSAEPLHCQRNGRLQAISTTASWQRLHADRQFENRDRRYRAGIEVRIKPGHDGRRRCGAQRFRHDVGVYQNHAGSVEVDAAGRRIADFVQNRREVDAWPAQRNEP